ncbi:MAG: hypothetical protein GX820_09015 [Bacteroidales bacterium]|nr:hypothetical protein [Bacteroidales bacterium]
MNTFVKQLFFIGFIFILTVGCSESEQKISIIPKPVSQKITKGNFILKKGTAIIYENEKLKSAADYLSNFFAISYQGYINVPEKAIYDFNLNTSSGKGALIIDEMKVVDNITELPRYYQRTGKIALDKGFHKVSIYYLVTIHEARLKLGCKFNDKNIAEIPASWFYH